MKVSFVFFKFLYFLLFIVSWRWFLTYIRSNFGSTFFGSSSLQFFFECLYITYSVFFVCLSCYLIYIYVFSTPLDLAGKRIRFPQGSSLVLYLYFRFFVFALLNCESFEIWNIEKKSLINLISLESHCNNTTEITLKEEELKLKKMKMKMFNFLCKIAADFNIWSQKLQSFLIKKIQF